MKVLIPLVAMFLLLGACSSGDSTDTLASEEGTTSSTAAPTTTSTAAPTTTEAPPEEEELDIPTEEDLIRTATWDGRDFFTLTANDMFADASSNCTESLADVEKWMTEGNAFMISLMDIDEMYSSVSSIEYQGDGSEALVFTDLLDAAGIVIDFGDGSDGSNSWLVEDGAWKINNVDC
jgi:hypothetical protein